MRPVMLTMTHKPKGELQLSPVIVTEDMVYQCYLRHTGLHGQYSWDDIKNDELLYYCIEKHAER